MIDVSGNIPPINARLGWMALVKATTLFHSSINLLKIYLLVFAREYYAANRVMTQTKYIWVTQCDFSCVTSHKLVTGESQGLLLLGIRKRHGPQL
jgi:hypothetical protein